LCWYGLDKYALSVFVLKNVPPLHEKSCLFYISQRGAQVEQLEKVVHSSSKLAKGVGYSHLKV
jgi:hypothetical protein